MKNFGDYIKIMSDGSQLFIEDTECFLFVDNKYVRPTIDEFCDMVKDDACLDFLGEHIVSPGHESTVRKIPENTRIWDSELCSLSEFYFVYENEPKQLDKNGNPII
jgi:hypothetical protein